MFKEALKEDLLAIFEMPKIVFASILGIEQDILYCDISESENDIKSGYEYARVKGEIAIITAQDKIKYGWLHKQIIRMSQEISLRLTFSKIEKRQVLEFQNGENVLERHSVDFTYIYRGEFDPKKEMAGVSWGNS